MKTIVSTLLLAFAFVQFGVAQPDMFNYQTVVRNNSGVPLANQDVSFRMSVRAGSASGTVVYQEIHNETTNEQGLVSFRIGDGSGSEDISTVNWAGNSHYLQVELDAEGGSSYEDMGTSQLVSVPYAMHAKTAEDVDDADADPTNELQNLSISGNTLSISQGNSVSIDGDPTNELQNLSISGNTLSISQGNSVQLPGGSAPPDEALAKAWVNFPIVGQPNLSFDAYNVTNTSVTSTGVRVVSLASGLFSIATNPVCVCQIRNDLAPGFCVVTSSTSPSQVTVRTYNANGQLENKEFSLVIFGK